MMFYHNGKVTNIEFGTRNGVCIFCVILLLEV